MKRETYVKDEIFVVRNESDATPKMEGPCEEKNGDGDADGPDHREDRKTYDGESRHWEVCRERKGKGQKDGNGRKGKRIYKN